MAYSWGGYLDNGQSIVIFHWPPSTPRSESITVGCSWHLTSLSMERHVGTPTTRKDETWKPSSAQIGIYCPCAVSTIATDDVDVLLWKRTREGNGKVNAQEKEIERCWQRRKNEAH